MSDADLSATRATGTSRRPVAVFVASFVLLCIVLASWVWWPRADPSADLVAATTTTSTAVTPPPAPAPEVTSGTEPGPPPTEARATAPSTATVTPPPSVPRQAQPPTTRRVAPARADPGAPTRLRIPAIGVDTSIVGVGLQSDGQMEVPPAALVGWYRLGPRPGAQGSAVLAAHIDYGGQRGAFYALPRLQVGDAVLVVESDGGERRYVVTERAQVAKADVDLSRYFTNDGPARISLITCGGAFNSSVGHYRDNIIITAVPA